MIVETPSAAPAKGRSARRDHHWRSPYLCWLATSWPVTAGRSGIPSPALLATASDLCQTAWTRPTGTTEALRRFGSAAGNEGWTVEQVFAWVGQLVATAPWRVRRRLHSPAAHRALAEGWAAEFVRGARTAVDATTGLSTTEALVERIGEVYRYCDHVELRPSSLFTLVIVDLSPDEELTAGGALSLAGHVVGDEFVDGETAAPVESRILVLCPVAMAGEDRLERLRSRLAAVGELPMALVWREDLPDRAEAMRRLLAEYGIAHR